MLVWGCWGQRTNRKQDLDESLHLKARPSYPISWNLNSHTVLPINAPQCLQHCFFFLSPAPVLFSLQSLTINVPLRFGYSPTYSRVYYCWSSPHQGSLDVPALQRPFWHPRANIPSCWHQASPVELSSHGIARRCFYLCRYGCSWWVWLLRLWWRSGGRRIAQSWGQWEIYDSDSSRLERRADGAGGVVGLTVTLRGKRRLGCVGGGGHEVDVELLIWIHKIKRSALTVLFTESFFSFSLLLTKTIDFQVSKASFHEQHQYNWRWSICWVHYSSSTELKARWESNIAWLWSTLSVTGEWQPALYREMVWST